MPRRERAIILGEILAALKNRPAYGQRSATQVAAATNVPYDRLMGYLEDLAARGLVRLDGRPTLTAQGLAFLRDYETWREVLVSYGLHPDQS